MTTGSPGRGRSMPPTARVPMEKLSNLEIVERFFSGTGSSYDRVVAVGTWGRDRYWKKRLLAHIPERPARIIDQACGTGIVTLEIARRYPNCHVTGVELRDEYLQQARAKALALGMTNVDFVLGRAEDVVLADGCDCIVSSYLAKYADLSLLIANAARMLRPAGVIALHDFTCPSNAIYRLVWRVQLWVLRLIGRRVFPEWLIVFDELPGFLQQTRWQSETETLLSRNGFVSVATEPLTFGAAAIVSGQMPPALPR
jgi:demethylmenaquinone methyltransferase / 2-methoxy-6-polyprenyl-1,4-benzoquinol methylase